MKYDDILELVKKQSVNVDKKSLSYAAGLGEAGMKKTKNELIESVMEHVSQHRYWLIEYMRKFGHELALNPKLLEETIGCTEEERIKWQKNGRLPLIYSKEVENEKSVPYYSIFHVAYETSDEILREWRENDKEGDVVRGDWYWFQIKEEIYIENNEICELADGVDWVDEAGANELIEDLEISIKELEHRLKNVARLDNGYILCVNQGKLEESWEYAICKITKGEDEIVLRSFISKECSKDEAVDILLCQLDKYDIHEVYFNDLCVLETKEIERKTGTSVRVVDSLEYFGLYGWNTHTDTWEIQEKAPLNLLDWKTTSYEYKNGFIVEVTERGTENGLLYDVFLSHKDYGEKKYMFGLMKKYLDKEQIKAWDGLSALMLNNIDRYIEMYRDEVMDKGGTRL